MLIQDRRAIYVWLLHPGRNFWARIEALVNRGKNVLIVYLSTFPKDLGGAKDKEDIEKLKKILTPLRDF